MLPHVTSSMFESALKQAVTRKVALSMPKFKVNTTAVLNSVLMSLGVEKAFSKGADFSGITSAGVAVDEVKQKCFVEVNESLAPQTEAVFREAGYTHTEIVKDLYDKNRYVFYHK